MTPSLASLKTKFSALLVAIADKLDTKLDKTAAAVTANALTNPFTLTVNGDASGSASIKGNVAVTLSVTLANTAVTAGTYSKVTVDSKGRVTGGAALAVADIPTLDAGKITTGTFADARIPSFDASKVTSGVFDLQRIPLPPKLATARRINGVPFDGSADITIEASGLGGFSVHNAGTGPLWGSAIPVVQSNGVTEIGRYIDFHATSGDGVDYTVRLDGGGTGSNTLNLAGHFVASGNVTAYSDVRLKTDIETIAGALEKIERMRGVMYTMVDSGDRHTGVIAQEVQDILPEVIHSGGEYLSVAYGNMAGVFIEAIKELSSEVRELKTRVNELENPT